MAWIARSEVAPGRFLYLYEVDEAYPNYRVRVAEPPCPMHVPSTTVGVGHPVAGQGLNVIVNHLAYHGNYPDHRRLEEAVKDLVALAELMGL